MHEETLQTKQDLVRRRLLTVTENSVPEKYMSNPTSCTSQRQEKQEVTESVLEKSMPFLISRMTLWLRQLETFQR